MEARIILHAPRAWGIIAEGAPAPRIWYCDGAVTCGLLAAECALKATLLHGYAVDRKDDLPGQVGDALFDSSRGHVIRLLWDRQARRVSDGASELLVEAIERLNGLDRYDHRYGGQRPDEKHAEQFVRCSEVVVGWMKQVLVS